jgi:hypothetical protein
MLLVLLLFNSLSFASILITSFRDGQTKIMMKYNRLNKSDREISAHYIHHDLKGLVESMIDLDSIIFFQEMLRVKDKIFLFTFWNTFVGQWIFLCNKDYNQKIHKEFKDFIAQISPGNLTVAGELQHNFKSYLMRALAIFEGDKSEMLFHARAFYELRLKNIILEVLGELQDDKLSAQLQEMDRNFWFYFLCIEKKNLKDLLTKEFHRLKTAIGKKEQKLFEVHSENMTFIDGILMHDRSNIFGFNLISDLSPKFIGYFLLMRYHQKGFLLRKFSIEDSKPEFYYQNLKKLVFEKIPIFEGQSFRTFSSPSRPLKEFTNEFGDILTNDDLIDLSKTLHRKIPN